VNGWKDGTRYTEQRVAEHGKVITVAGVSADIDLALTLLARMHGPQLAQMVRLGIEYDPQPPFDAGSPFKALRRTRSTSTHAGMDCPQGERRERKWPQSRAKKRGPASGRR
jgi:hypothetical protein